MFITIAAVVFSPVTSLIAALHVVWAVGSTWPARNEVELMARVIGTAPGGRMPPAPACYAVALAFMVATLLPLNAVGWIPLPLTPELVGLFLWVLVGVLVARGLYGYVDHRFRPGIIDTPFMQLNRRYYSPLCLLLAGLAAVVRLG